ncbi:MAG TPA: hypothetical protein VGG41_00215 [Solirubrobacteraceae bacterium]|jgi:hypothetical protein
MSHRPRARSTGILTERLGDELVVYDTVSRSAHCLSADAAAVWELCDGARPTEEIARELDVAVEVVTRAVAELGDAGLLESAVGAERGVSRRELTKRFATIGAAAVSAPLVYSVAIPRAAAAMSGPTGPTDLCAGKDCVDHNACTTDECDPRTGECRNIPITCDDNNPCTTDTCDPVKGCIYMPVVCPPSTNPCETSICDPGTGACKPVALADDTRCDGDGYCRDGVCITA